LLTIAFFTYRYYVPEANVLTTRSAGNAIDQIVMETNGVLTPKWLQKYLKLPRKTKLMEVNLYKLRKQLESFGQIKHATLEREFPDKLKITIEEYQPIMSIALKDSQGKLKRLLVSPEGHLYTGYSYSREALKQLPFLGGAAISIDKNGNESVKNLQPIAEFVMTVKKYKPDLFKQFIAVSSDFLKEGTRIENETIDVLTKSKAKIIFAMGDYLEQLDRLDYILNYVYRYQMPNVRRIDLALGSEAAVQFKDKNITKKQYTR